MDLRWTVSFSASCLHAAEAIAHGKLVVDTKMAEAITEPAQLLRRTIQAAGLPRTPFWRNLVGLSVTVDGTRELAERAVTKTVGGSRANAIAPELAASIANVESAVRHAFPNLVDELAVRVRPLRDQWEARGPGLVHSIARWTDPRLVTPEANVVLVHPSLGGGGSAHLPYNNVHIEGVLTNPVPELPEILRLGWLLSQLNLDLPMFSETIHGKRLPHVAELAMLPVTLKAADDVELTTLTPETLDLALRSWHVVTPPDVDPVDILWRWWGTYTETRPRWSVAFTALDRMFE
jgi:hypothetical protein